MKTLDKITLFLMALMVIAPVALYIIMELPFWFCWILTVLAGVNFYRCWKETVI